MKWTLPQKTEWMESQMNHESSNAYAEDIFNLIKKYPYEEALEIGAAWGLSTLSILLAQEKGKLISVDKDENVKAIKEVEVNGLGDRWQFINQSSDKFWQENQEKKELYDIIYIDGSHLYEDVYNDLFNAWDYCKAGGLIFLDDVTHKNNLKIDNNRLETVYGISLAAWQLVFAKNIKDIQTTSRLLAFIKK